MDYNTIVSRGNIEICLWHPLSKTAAHGILFAGVIPIVKKIAVTDELNNTYEATYPKRAKGLVKRGRAYFIDKETICLVRPTNDDLEDKKMSDNINRSAENKTEPEYTISYILAQIEQISSQTSLIKDAASELSRMTDDSDGCISKVNAIADIVKSRETTNQQILKLYEKMYDDLKPKPQPIKAKALDIAERTINNPNCGDKERECLQNVLASIEKISE